MTNLFMASFAIAVNPSLPTLCLNFKFYIKWNLTQNPEFFPVFIKKKYKGKVTLAVRKVCVTPCAKRQK